MGSSDRCTYRSGDNACISEAGHTDFGELMMSDEPLLEPMPPLRWCQECGDSIEGQGRRVCAMCEADVAEREEHQ